MRGAALGLDGLGKPILAMPSATKKGETKIVPVLKAGLCYSPQEGSVPMPQRALCLFTAL